jgi:hypothetical protein
MPSKDDKFEGEQCRVKVNPSGGYFHLHNEGDISEINLTDIASALSRQCRFNGHLLPGIEFYSVAEHSVLVSYILEKMEAPPEVIFQGLMHDTAEAYIGDMAAPFKREIKDYCRMEELVQTRINSRFNLPPELDPRVKDADWFALFIEARQLVCPDEEDLSTWQGYEEYGEDSKHMKFPIRGWVPSMARNEFLARFAQCLDGLYEHPEVLE